MANENENMKKFGDSFKKRTQEGTTETGKSAWENLKSAVGMSPEPSPSPNAMERRKKAMDEKSGY